MCTTTLVLALVALASPTAASARFGFLRQWGSTGSGTGQFTQPHAVAVSPSPDNRVFVADTGNQRVERFDRAGGGATVIVPPADSGPGYLHFPEGIAVDSSQVYVVDFNGLHAYSLDGAVQWERIFMGSGDGALNVPASVSVDRAAGGLVYVADTRNNRIAEFTKGGTWVRNVGKNTGDGTAGTGFGEFTLPVGVLFEPARGAVWVTEDQSDRLTVMGPTGAGASLYTENGLKNPKEMAVADTSAFAPGLANSVWVADSVFEDPHLLLSDGNPRGELRGAEPAPGKFGAQGVATDGDGNLFILDIESDHDDRVLVYGKVPDPPPGSTDHDPPVVSGLENGDIYTRRVRKRDRAIPIPVKPNEDTSFEGEATIASGVCGGGCAISAVRLKLKRRLVRAHEKARLKLVIPRTARRRVWRSLERRALTAKVTLTATDRAGNASRYRFKIRLKRVRG
jgi:sugar lactone lactonase YvrE